MLEACRHWLPEWAAPEVSPVWVWSAGLISLALAAASVGAVYVWIGALPEDYFCAPFPRLDRDRPRSHWHLAGRWLLLLIRQLLGTMLVAVGVAMLVLPGQGLLTLLAGLAVLRFPGRTRLVRWLVSRPAVRTGLNGLRRRAGKRALRFD